jgi:hypothetical protein
VVVGFAHACSAFDLGIKLDPRGGYMTDLGFENTHERRGQTPEKKQGVQEKADVVWHRLHRLPIIFGSVPDRTTVELLLDPAHASEFARTLAEGVVGSDVLLAGQEGERSPVLTRLLADRLLKPAISVEESGYAYQPTSWADWVFTQMMKVDGFNGILDEDALNAAQAGVLSRIPPQTTQT